MVEVLAFVSKASFGLACLAMIVGFTGVLFEDRPRGAPAWQETAWITMYWGYGVAVVCFVLADVLD
jgi:hypothetical protein